MNVEKLLVGCWISALVGCSGGSNGADAATEEDTTPAGDTGVDPAGDTAVADTTPEPGPVCTDEGKTCKVSGDCCPGRFCFSGSCGTCPADHPQYCAELGGGCWEPGVVCSTVKDCSGAKWGCFYSFLTYDCSTKTCNCPADYPVWCGPGGGLPAECWSKGVDCTSRTSCGGKTYACTGTGYHYDCATGKCVTGSVTPPPPTTVPSWLVGTYSRRGKEENNVYFTSDDRSITFNADGTYSDKLGKATASSGKFTVTGDVLTFSTGPLSSQTINLKSRFDSTCRILYGFGSALWRYNEVPSCPTFARVAATDCGSVGTFTTKSSSGSFSGSGSGTVTDYTTTVTLYRDRFYTYDSSTFRTTCFSGTCKSLSSSIQTVVGDWSVSGGAPPYTLATLKTWSFSKSSSACPGP